LPSSRFLNTLGRATPPPARRGGRGDADRAGPDPACFAHPALDVALLDGVGDDARHSSRRDADRSRDLGERFRSVGNESRRCAGAALADAHGLSNAGGGLGFAARAGRLALFAGLLTPFRGENGLSLFFRVFSAQASSVSLDLLSIRRTKPHPERRLPIEGHDAYPRGPTRQTNGRMLIG